MVQVPTGAPFDSFTRQMHRVLRCPCRGRIQEHLTVRPLHDHMHWYVGRSAGVVAQQRHHLRCFARPIDAAIQPDVGIERSRVRQPGHSAIGQVECCAAEVEQSCSRRRPAPRSRAARPGLRRASVVRRSGRHRRRRWWSRRESRCSRRAGGASRRSAGARPNSRAPARSARRCRARSWARSRCAGSSARRSAHSACRRRRGRSAHRGRVRIPASASGIGSAVCALRFGCQSGMSALPCQTMRPVCSPIRRRPRNRPAGPAWRFARSR